MPSLCSIWEASESNYLTWIHTFIHVPPPIPTLTYELFEGEFLWSASASVQWRPSQLALTSNELCRAVRAGRHRFDKAQVNVRAAEVGVSWPPLGGILTGGASDRKPLLHWTQLLLRQTRRSTSSIFIKNSGLSLNFHWLIYFFHLLSAKSSKRKWNEQMGTELRCLSA